MHIELNNLYEDKIRKTILYLVDKIDWPTFHEKLVKIINMWEEIKDGEDYLKPIMNKWGGRDKYITLLCISVISLSCEQIEITFDMTSNLSEFDEKRVAV